MDCACDAYNKAVASLESRVVPSARRFKELGVPAPNEIETVDAVERAPRALQAPELAGPPAREGS